MIRNFITISVIADLYQILEEPLYLSGDLEQVDKEIVYNAWGIMLDDKFAKIIRVENLAEFFFDMIKYRTEEIMKIKPAMNATLYIWFDDMALQLCFNILSGEDRELPFGCKLNIVDSPYIIFQEYINSLLHGNYLRFTEVLEQGDFDFNDDEDDFYNDYVQDVWKITLPWTE